MTATPFQLESLNYQTDAVDAVVRVFDGTPKTQVHELAGNRCPLRLGDLLYQLGLPKRDDGLVRAHQRRRGFRVRAQD